jgi:threonine/homoserine/homoserine lactone efflux protein
MDLMPLINGLGTGFVLSLMLGTVFFALIKTSIHHGYRSGILIAIGVVVSDIIFISIALFGTSLMPKLEKYETATTLIGCSMLIIFGIMSIVKKTDLTVKLPRSRLKSVLHYASSGFFLNALNPINLLAWLAVATYLEGSLKYTLGQSVLFFIGTLMAIFITESVISWSAFRLKKYLTPNGLKMINRIAGIAFILFGLRLFYTLDFVKEFFAGLF